MGVKRFGDQYVKAGEILLRQRGTSWHPGQHVRRARVSCSTFLKADLRETLQVGIGKDHTLWAKEPGYVRMYTDSGGKTSQRIVRSERRYIGIALTPEEKLPRDEGELGRSRRLGLSLVDA